MSRLTKRREPFRFMIWLGIGGSVLLFTVLLGIYIVRQTGPGWSDVALPNVFVLSTLVILLSSLTLHNANRAFRHEQFSVYRINMATTLVLGTLFILLQGWGWRQMVRSGVGLQGNPAGGFVYIISGLHLLHILIGLVFITITLVEALRRRAYVEAFVYSVNPPNQLKIKLITLYWHFVDVLWVVLFVFLLFHHRVDWRL
ncbi:cytochrome c oxidase subunit 3 [Fibrivirga algicola]|uniref:Heme-copper oxidase subunit III n=1 Tax=Fibrivirga algicola TaxID=2950420 RepID=A0ABX0QF34_9BACT|nr:cytochrome c oxidase subunit 3 [Fibrivirga algicola]ARK10926.1 cytochrome oxidase subunit III [Fibrella sp. ES10-3-2-2]NID09825.1 heme-copper oxidase subunit III [Fibrivirga algicola]